MTPFHSLDAPQRADALKEAAEQLGIRAFFLPRLRAGGIRTKGGISLSFTATHPSAALGFSNCFFAEFRRI